MRFVASTLVAISTALVAMLSATAGVSGQDSASTTLAPTVVRTIALSRCGAAALSTADANCRGFDAREVRENPDIFVVGFENNQDLDEKHVLQVVASFDLGQISLDPDTEVTRASLGYGESSTTRRSASGDSEYGVLPTCNTQLGVPTSAWAGRTDAILATRPALTAGATPATTGDFGAWDVTPQIREWLASGQTQGTLVMRGDDESPDIHAQSMCLSYLFDINLTVETAPKP